jgi:hypothetical protein
MHCQKSLLSQNPGYVFKSRLVSANCVGKLPAAGHQLLSSLLCLIQTDIMYTGQGLVWHITYALHQLKRCQCSLISVVTRLQVG